MKTLLSRNFCQKRVRVNFSNFHIVHLCTYLHTYMYAVTMITKEKFREINKVWQNFSKCVGFTNFSLVSGLNTCWDITFLLRNCSNFWLQIFFHFAFLVLKPWKSSHTYSSIGLGNKHFSKSALVKSRVEFGCENGSLEFLLCGHQWFLVQELIRIFVSIHH